MNRSLALAALAAALLMAACASGGAHPFEATAYEYNINASPQVKSRKFGCSVKKFEEGVVRVIEIRNFISQKAEPDVTVKIVTSNDTAASIIYNAKMEKIAEYPRGQYVNENLMLFTGGDGQRKITGKWFTDSNCLMSDFTISDEKGVLLYKETVIYTAKSPSR